MSDIGYYTVWEIGFSGLKVKPTRSEDCTKSVCHPGRLVNTELSIDSLERRVSG
jgi:hypothetical protein